MSAKSALRQTKPAVREPAEATTKAIQTRSKLLDAGVYLFSYNGYDATGTRAIETHAGVKRNLISYHFGSKEEFWKACMTQLFQPITAHLQPAIEQSRDIEPAERIRFLIRRFVRVNAANPEINRIMFDVGRSSNWRLQWIVDHYGRNFYNAVIELFQEGVRHQVISDLTPIQFYYLLVGSTSIFTMAPECRLLTGEDPHTAAMIDAQADAVAALLTNRTGDS